MTTENPFVREFTMADGRKILIDKRAVGFVVEDKERPTGCVVGWRGQAKPVPISAAWEEVAAWTSEFTSEPNPKRHRPAPSPRPAGAWQGKAPLAARR